MSNAWSWGESPFHFLIGRLKVFRLHLFTRNFHSISTSLISVFTQPHINNGAGCFLGVRISAIVLSHC